MRHLRRLLPEVLAVSGGALLLVAAALGLLPGDGSWADRFIQLVRAGVMLDFGDSTAFRSPVREVVTRAAGYSVSIIVGTALVLLVVGVPMGIHAGKHPDARYVRVTRRILEAISTLPVLFWSTLAFLVLARGFKVFLRGGTNAVAAVATAVLVVFLGDRLLADLVQRVAMRTREVLAEPYMRTVQAANFGVQHHLLRSLVPTMADVIASRAMFLAGGAIVAERVFEINGLGLTIIKALGRGDREPMVVLASAMILVLLGLGLRLLTRVASEAADPRLRA